MRVSMRVEGGQQLARALTQMSTRASKSALRETLRTVGAPPLQQGMSQRAPVDPGAPDLANHIAISTARSGPGPQAAIAVGPSTEARTDQPSRTYALQGRFVEFGTSDTPMQPFVRPTFDQDAPRVIPAILGALWRAVIGRGVVSTRGESTGGGLE